MADSQASRIRYTGAMALETQPQARQFRLPAAPGRKSSAIEMWRLSAGSAVAEIAPARGGLITRFAVGEDEVLYLEPSTLIDESQLVRGGIPILFPIAGRLPGDRYQIQGHSFPMRQDGLARQAPWRVTNVAAAHLTMEFHTVPATWTSYPFDFSYRLTVDVGRAGYRSLVLESEIRNFGRAPMPVHTGLQPHFLVPDEYKELCGVELAADSAHDRIRNGPQPWPGGGRFGAGEIDLYLANLTTSSATLHVPGRLPRQLSWNGIYKAAVLSTLALKDFVCVAPWSGPANALNTGEGLIFVPPGEALSGQFIISV